MSEKKGLSPLAWIAIGCGGIVLIGLIVVVAGGLFVAKKASDFVEDAQKNPAYTYARLIAATNPDIEVVDRDDEKQMVSLKNLKTNEVVTLNLEDLEQGRISWVTADGEVKIGANVGDIPSWVPIPPGSEANLNYSATENGEASGMVTYTVDDSVDEVITWYKEKLESDGYQLQSHNADMGEQGQTGTLVGVDEESGRRITINAASQEDGSSAGSITFGMK